MSTIVEGVEAITRAITVRSASLRGGYLERIAEAKKDRPERSALGCGNLAHGFAACGSDDKDRLKLMNSANIGIVTAYNDMLSAHQPYADYPEKIKAALRDIGSTAQVAGAVPAMCDGVTQGMPGMELSLFSRDVIAQATAVSLSHQMFDGVICLGICDKIVPGLFIGAMSFGHLPAVFIPSGPMPSGMANQQKAQIRQQFAEGKIGRDALLAGEMASYHSPGTCTFYGTANSNQMILEALGVQLPGASFVAPDTPLREALTSYAAKYLVGITEPGGKRKALAEVIDERAIVNAMVALLASGGSTNHSIHLVAMARAAGLLINWDDFDALSKVVPLITRVYPNGQADINHFHAAGGTTYLFSELIKHGLMYGDANSMWGESFAETLREPLLEGGNLAWRTAVSTSLDADVLTHVDKPFDIEGGLRLLTGNLGRAIIKVSAVKPEHRVVLAPAIVIDDQQTLQQKFDRGELFRDCVIVLTGQGPKANGMPELHKLTPVLGLLQDRGHKVALVTDGRMSGASGKVPAAIQVTPEAIAGGALGLIREGDNILVDAECGLLEAQVDQATWRQRQAKAQAVSVSYGSGRELFTGFRRQVSSAEQGGTVLFEY